MRYKSITIPAVYNFIDLALYIIKFLKPKITESEVTRNCRPLNPYFRLGNR